jgi:ABC-type sugar transport system permease subunit
MTDRNAGGGPSLRQRRQRRGLLVPGAHALALFCVAAWPLLRTIWFSLTDTTLSNLYGGAWIGFDNYLSMRTLDSGKVDLARHAGRSGLVERGLEHGALFLRLGLLRDLCWA